MTSKRSGKRSAEEIAGTKRGFTLFALLLMAVGITLIATSFGLQAMPAKTLWNKEQAEAHRDASIKYHNDQFDNSISKSQLKASREEFARLDEKLSRAKTTRNRWPVLLRWSGIGSTLVGIVVLLLVRSFDD